MNQKIISWTSLFDSYICYIVIYIIIQHHNDTTSKTDAWINDARSNN